MNQEREAVAQLLRDHIRVDATGLAPAIASTFIVGFEEATDAIIALIRSGGEGWRDISTAPKDGAKVDLWVEFPEYNNGTVTVPAQGQRWANSSWTPGGWLSPSGFLVDQYNPKPTVTHWMPLPPAPDREG